MLCNNLPPNHRPASDTGPPFFTRPWCRSFDNGNGSSRLENLKRDAHSCRTRLRTECAVSRPLPPPQNQRWDFPSRHLVWWELFGRAESGLPPCQRICEKRLALSFFTRQSLVPVWVSGIAAASTHTRRLRIQRLPLPSRSGSVKPPPSARLFSTLFCHTVLNFTFETS